MAKEKISATLDPERLKAARALTGATTLSGLLDEALAALIEREQERRWLAAHLGNAAPDLSGEVEPDLSAVPWEE